MPLSSRAWTCPPVIEIWGERVAERKLDSAPKSDGPFVRIYIRDNGIGFNTEHSENIFNIFQRLHRKTDFEGTGIGLAICKKIVQNHQGYIYATSEKGIGTTFHVMLPA